MGQYSSLINYFLKKLDQHDTSCDQDQGCEEDEGQTLFNEVADGFAERAEQSGFKEEAGAAGDDTGRDKGE